MNLDARLENFPEGYFEAFFKGRRWGVTKSVSSRGRSVKIYAEELGGSDFVSCNFYRTSGGWIQRPCEMPLEKVLTFLRDCSAV